MMPVTGQQTVDSSTLHLCRLTDNRQQAQRGVGHSFIAPLHRASLCLEYFYIAYSSVNIKQRTLWGYLHKPQRCNNAWWWSVKWTLLDWKWVQVNILKHIRSSQGLCLKGHLCPSVCMCLSQGACVICTILTSWRWIAPFAATDFIRSGAGTHT